MLTNFRPQLSSGCVRFLEPFMDGKPPKPTWQRSSRCDVNGSCVEVARISASQIGVRDGKIGAASPVLVFGHAQWRGFVTAVATGKFDVS
jgi:hypothetical protein